MFGGIRKIDTHGVIKDYIKIDYAKGDVLYVPVTQLDMVTKYIGDVYKRQHLYRNRHPCYRMPLTVRLRLYPMNKEYRYHDGIR